MEENKKLQSYLNHVISCACGREHSCPIREIDITPGALKRLPMLLRKYGFQRPLFVYDRTTYGLAGDDLTKALEEEAYAVDCLILPYREPVADMALCKEIEEAILPDTDVLVAVGAGTVNDTCRYVSFQKKLPYFVAGTAPSMDGYASNVSPLIVDQLKITYEAQVPLVIVADPEMLAKAPMSMIAAGVGDILGKYTCLADWKIASIVTEEYYCEEIAELVKKAIDTVVCNLDKVALRDEESIAGIMEGLILSGIAMSYVGNSRPASGSEHHLSHYWEMMFLMEGKPPVFHGTKVGIGTVVVLELYKQLLRRSESGIDFAAACKKADDFSMENWSKRMEAAYGAAAADVIALEETVHKNAPFLVKKRLRILEENWEQIVGIIKELPKPEEVANMLHMLGAPVKPSEVGISDKQVEYAVKTAKELRNRFGILQMRFDLQME